MGAIPPAMLSLGKKFSICQQFLTAEREEKRLCWRDCFVFLPLEDKPRGAGRRTPSRAGKEARREGKGPVPPGRARGWQGAPPAQLRPVPQLGPAQRDRATGSGPASPALPAAEAAAGAVPGPGRTPSGGSEEGGPCPRTGSSAGGRKRGSPGCWTHSGAARRLPQHFQTRFSISLPAHSNANRPLSEAASPSPRPVPEPSLGAAGAAGPPCGAAGAERSLDPPQQAGQHFFWFYF